ncbi:pimeloyl-ACP methyl ester carboxylesterase [Actimicrobium sp. GrIS 1.19]|uniref:alpha/beta fold hydrolase n=1 Tax=Actimicrobium sp. GrIS 1.19 TaxID=3071708 RepID=UPI002E0284E4|nr:pimeloyl-ACP methyl ester carboxylesterase [Actimicrobium sp. GrIS 1.19]
MTAAIESGQFATLPNGTRLHFASAGKPGAPLILFVHGFPEFWAEWEAQLQEFGTTHYAVAPDLRGFNLSDMPADLGAYKARHIVDDLRLLAAQLGYDRFVLVAHDWGGAIAWNLAIALPQLLHQLIIINSPHPYLFMQALANDPAQQASSQYMNWLRAEGAEAALEKDDFALLDGFFNGMGQPEAPWFTEAVRQRYHACWRHGITGGLNYYRASPLHPATEGHPGPTALQLDPAAFRVTVPTRVIWGEADMALPKSLLDGLDGFIDDLQIERVAAGSHWIVHEQPALVNGFLRKFIG